VKLDFYYNKPFLAYFTIICWRKWKGKNGLIYFPHLCTWPVRFIRIGCTWTWPWLWTWTHYLNMYCSCTCSCTCTCSWTCTGSCTCTYCIHLHVRKALHEHKHEHEHEFEHEHDHIQNMWTFHVCAHLHVYTVSAKKCAR
jgi:hypothetical protein